MRNRRSLIFMVTLAKGVKNEFDPAGNSQLFEDPIEIIPYRMLLNFEILELFRGSSGRQRQGEPLLPRAESIVAIRRHC